MRKTSTDFLIVDQTTTGAGTVGGVAVVKEPWGNVYTFHGYGSVSTSTGAAAVKVQVSNDAVSWIDMGTITLTLGTSVTADGFSAVVPWKYFRGNVSSISGTDAKVSLIIGNLA